MRFSWARAGGTVDFGLVSFGVALGDPAPVASVIGEYTPYEGRTLGYGYRNVLRCPPDIGLTDLAVAAGGQALAAAEVEPAELDLIVLAVTDITEYLYWDAAASITYRLGAANAEACLINQACAGGVLSLDTVAGKLATHPGYHTALVVAANRCCETYWNRMQTQPLVFSDGAAATVARRGHRNLRWLATEALTEGRYADFYRLDEGGAAAPFGPRTAALPGPRARDAWGVMEFFEHDVQRLKEFTADLDRRAKVVFDRACARTGTNVADLAKVILLSENQAAMSALADTLGVPLSLTNLDLALEHGHLGAADYLFGLSRYSADGDLPTGCRVALVARGRGMHWACAILEA
jgi:3-oxoacyl-[acyl-carrier-protein] synthase III